MEPLHQHFSQHIHCNGKNASECSCREFIAEELSFFLQSSSVGDDFLAYLSNYVPPVCDAKSGHHLPIKYDDTVSNLLFMFFKLCVDLDEQIESFINSFGPAQLINEPSIRLFLQNVVLSTIFSQDIQLRLQYVVQAYLNLELEASEIARPEQNVFESFMKYRMEPNKMELLQTGRLINESRRYVRLEYFIHSTYLSFILSALSGRVRSLCSDNYTEPLLDPVLNYTQWVVRKHWMKSLFSDPETLRNAQAQLKDEHIYKLFYDIRKPDIFSIIIEFPDSMDALLDLSKCFNNVPIRQDLIAHLKEEVKQRLLHPGVHTEQILVAYSYLVRALRIIDKSFLAQDIVCRPVSLCLRQREDAVRCIVDKLICAPELNKSASKYPKENFDDDQIPKTGVFGGPSTELHSELLLPKPLEVEQGDAEDSDADVVAEDPPFDHDVPLLHSLGVAPTDTGMRPGNCLPHWGSDWQPDPVEAMYQSGRWRRRLDLLSMLVSIYGSKKAFLVEYRQLLSQRLLRQRSFQTAHELHNLELLKLRFGEQNLYECEVMLKDIRDSKRIALLMSEANTASAGTVAGRSSVTAPGSTGPSTQGQQAGVSQNLSNLDGRRLATAATHTFPVSVFVLSAHYWPEILDDHFKIPDELCTAFRHYERLFQRFKANRTLQWMHKLGLVNIDLMLGNRKVQLDVTPLQISIIHFFSRQATWNVRDLAQELQTSTSTVRQGLQLFLQLGFIRQGSYETDAHRTCAAAEIYSVSPVASGQGSSMDRQATAPAATSDPWMLIGGHEHQNEDSGDIMSSVRNRQEKELHVFWTYIVAMLTNLGNLSLDRIHSMLRMFALNSTSTLECNREELRQFLDTKIRAAQITFDGEVYRIVKPD